MPDCVHHWLLGQPDIDLGKLRATILYTCKKCNKTKKHSYSIAHLEEQSYNRFRLSGSKRWKKA